MSSLEWSRYMRDVVGLTEEPEEISAEVVRRLEDRYRRELPLIAGAEQAVERLAARWPLALASSSNRELIDLVLESSGLGRYFEASVSSEEVARGKPAPDVFLEAARRLGVDPTRCAAVEDSENGILAAKAAGMRTIAIPNRSIRHTTTRSRPPTSCSPPSRSLAPGHRRSGLDPRSNGGRLDVSRNGSVQSPVNAADEDAAVVAAEAHRVRERDAHVGLARLVRHVVEVARRVRVLVVDRRRNDAVVHRERAHDRLDRALPPRRCGP